MSSSVAAGMLRLAASVVLSPPALAGMLMIAVLMIALILAWGTLRLALPRQSKALAQSDEMLLLELRNIGGATVLVVVNVPLSILDALASIASLITDNFQTILVMLILGVAALGFNFIQPEFCDAGFGLRCTLNWVIETFLWPLLNLARIVYAAVWPVIDVGAEWWKFVTTDYYRLLTACTTPTDLYNVLRFVAMAVGDVVTALADWLSADLATARIDFLPALANLGNAANEALDPLSCFCDFLTPLWQLLVAIPQLASLHVTIDDSINVGVRLLQLLMELIFYHPGNFESGPLTVEVNGVIIAAGDTIQDIVLLVTDAIFGLLQELGILSMSAGAAAAGISPVTTLADLFHTADIPPPFWQQPGGGDLINNTIGLKQLIQLLSAPYMHIVTEPFALFSSLANITLMAVTHPTCITFFNNTCDCLFDAPTGMRYLQLGILGDRWRACVDAVASLFVIFDANMPAVASHLGHVYVYTVQTVFELIIDIIYAIVRLLVYAYMSRSGHFTERILQVFPPWVPGVPPTVDCGCGDCTIDCMGAVPCPPSYTFLEVLPYYFNWSGACINVARDEVELAGEALATLLGSIPFITLGSGSKYTPP